MRLKNTKNKIKIYPIEELRKMYENTISGNKKEIVQRDNNRKAYSKYAFIRLLRESLIRKFGVDEYEATDEMIKLVLYHKVLSSQNYFNEREINSFIKEVKNASKLSLMKFAKKIYTASSLRRKKFVYV